MPRKLRLQYEGAIYHLMDRGDRKELVFLDDKDRQMFLATLAETCEKTAWQVHAYCLMPNHFHLVAETPRANLVGGMHWLLSTYTIRFNHRHRYAGHVFSGRYKSLLVDGSGNGYLKTVCDYVHLNPARAGLIGKEQPLETHTWSSYPFYLAPPNRRPAWLRVDRLFGEYRLPQDRRAGRERFAREMESRRHAEEAASYGHIRQGWFLGSDSLRQKLLAQMEGASGMSHCAEVRRETDEAKAVRLLAAALKESGWTESELTRRRKTDPGKAQLAKRLRRETTMTWPWIAARLRMGTWRTARNAVAALDRTPATAAEAMIVK
jgi:REP element-mobilizing transposase RayT